MRVVMASIGTAGDVHPYVAIALALKRRGHEVVMVANPVFKDRVLGAGIGFWGVGTEDEYRAMVTHRGLVTARSSAMWVFENLIMAGFDELARQVSEAVRVMRADVVVAHHIALGALAAAEAMGVARVQGVLAPLFWLSREEALAMPSWPMPDAPRWVRRAQAEAFRIVGKLTIDPAVNKARRAVGAKAIRNFAGTGARGGDGLRASERLGRASEGVRTLGLWSPVFRGKKKDDPITGTICGFCAWDRPTGDDAGITQAAELRKWMEDGEPPVLVTLGSSVSHHGGEIYEACAKACGELGVRAVMLTGEGAQRDWGRHVRAAAYVPYGVMMGRASVVVHHAGIGTLAAALRAGTASVIVPFANDEFDNAVRARRLGVARVVARRKAGAKGMREALEAVLEDEGMRARAREIAAAMQEERGAERAAEEIEKVAR